jgi:[protein-PII] uridylyltransferase
MNRYGVLAAYIPAFARVVGRMQYDLFHVYTVDEHSLFVLRNARRLMVPELREELPFASAMAQALPKRELLYLAALFHDLGKGQDGDHSEIGAVEAELFCRAHGLSLYDTRLVAWLVRYHLLMSMTAQRRDITDPVVISDFARRVGDESHLRYLYLLTVSDIRGTNPSLWNAWKEALLRELYESTRRALRRGLENPIDKDQRVREIKQAARARLDASGLPWARIARLWGPIPDDYFLRHTPEEIAWQTRAIDGVAPADLPLVRIHRDAERGTTCIFVYAPNKAQLFADTTAILDRLGLNILDARIISTEDGCSFNTYLVLEESGDAIPDDFRVVEIQRSLEEGLSADALTPAMPTRRAPRRLKCFKTPTSVEFVHDEHNNRTIMELITADRPGLLSRVGRAFAECGVRVSNAKIATIGERAEDVFFVTDADQRPLTDAARCACVRDAVLRYLNS